LAGGQTPIKGRNKKGILCLESSFSGAFLSIKNEENLHEGWSEERRGKRRGKAWDEEGEEILLK